MDNIIHVYYIIHVRTCIARLFFFFETYQKIKRITLKKTVFSAKYFVLCIFIFKAKVLHNSLAKYCTTLLQRTKVRGWGWPAKARGARRNWILTSWNSHDEKGSKWETLGL